MRREINTKFYTFNQNNSGGYFIVSDNYGVCEFVIIEAATFYDAYSKLESIGDNVSNMFNYCTCCGERWSNYGDDDDGTETPEIYGVEVFKIKKEHFVSRCFIHYYDGTIKGLVFKE